MDDKRFDWLKQDLESMKSEIKSEIKDVKKSVDALNQFKWQIVGSSTGISLIITILFQVYLAFKK